MRITQLLLKIYIAAPESNTRSPLPSWPKTSGGDGPAPAGLPPGMGLRQCPATGLWLVSPVSACRHFAE
ncbi:MAG: hypothetical protein RJA22_2113 [Verrucomicrobiota bacterium]|jgi:hypothetical protein